MSATPKDKRKEKTEKIAVSNAPAKQKKTAAKVEVIPKSTDGHKPDTTEFDSEYNPVKVENAWYSWWEKQGYFKPQGNGEKFVILQPPPNVTGELHLGHALTSAIEDALTRYHRMKGDRTLWIPGTDHAGIATQVRVEKKIFDEQGLTRNEIPREKFMEEAFKWVESKSGTILGQLRDIGASVDWDRSFYTLDGERNKSVNAAFVELFDRGLIYRGERLVNWDCALQTAISDAEVEYQTLTKRTLLHVPNHKYESYPFGVMTHFLYQVADAEGNPTDEKVEIATTRLETILGDTAVAIHPDDERYKHLHGKRVFHPFRRCTIPIICDAVLVDKDFGTGVVKVTPAHDPNDFETGKRHNLEFINIFTKDGRINDICEEFAGMMRFDARKAIGQRMKEMGLFVCEKDHEMRLGITQRGHDVVEQVIGFQWFINTSEMAARAIKAVDDGELKIFPEEFVTDWRKWHENIRPWCISRQLIWGHRIPAFRVSVDGAAMEGGDEWVAAATAEEALAKAAAKLGVDKSRVSVEQDPDVLDTWFSSALLPFSSLGWPEATSDLSEFFPNSILETGWDILTFWVSRMVMMSLELTGKVPFHTILLHPLVRDAQGRKMSKSLGNVIDPRHVINSIELSELVREIEESTLDEKEKAKAIAGRKADFPQGIPQCGTDAMRIALASFCGATRTANLNLSVIIRFRNFCNKMWNAVRFALPNFASFDPSRSAEALSAGRLSVLDKWALKQLTAAVRAATLGLTEFKMSDAVTALYSFFTDKFCAVYLEGIKPVVNDKSEGAADARETVAAVLYECIETTMRVLHPFMPYVTEELWQRLPRRFAVESVMVAPYPEANTEWEAFDAGVVDAAMEAVSAVRSIKQAYGIRSREIETLVCTSVAGMEGLAGFIGALGDVKGVKVVPHDTPTAAGYSTQVVSEATEVRLNLVGQVDFKKELQRLEKKRAPLTKQLASYEKKFANPNYASKVAPDVQKLEREKMDACVAQIAAIDKSIAEIKPLIE